MTALAGLSDMIAELERLAKGDSAARALPPVEKWNPQVCGDIGMEIRSDGSWWHEGVRITREPLVRLFSTILRKDEDGTTWLVTPGEKVSVAVADAPFIAVRVDRIGEGVDTALVFTTSLGDVAVAGPDRPIIVKRDPATGAPRPYVRIRGRLDARIGRAPFFELVDMAEERSDGQLWVRSAGADFALGPVA
jgi:uncharacterized protein